MVDDGKVLAWGSQQREQGAPRPSNLSGTRAIPRASHSCLALLPLCLR